MKLVSKTGNFRRTESDPQPDPESELGSTEKLPAPRIRHLKGYMKEHVFCCNTDITQKSCNF